MADVEQEAPLVAGEWMASKSTSRRGMVIASAVTLLLASSLSVTAGYVYLHREQFKAVTNAHGPSMEEHSKLPFPDKRDIQDLLNVFQDMFPDGSVFKEVKYLDIDNSDPSNIKSKPKHVVHPNVTMQKLRMLQEETPVMDLSYMQQLNIGMCAIDAYQSALTIGQIATNIHALVDACKSPYPQNPEQQDFCGGLVSLNLALWGYLACFIEDMVSSCGPEFNLNAGCSLDVTGLLTNSFLAASAGAGMKQNCLPPGGYKETTPPPITADPALRRDFTGKELALLKKIVEKLRESEAFQAMQSRDRQKRNFAIGAGARRLEEFTELPGAPFEEQKADLESDAEYLKKRANELLQKIGGRNGDEEIEEPTPEAGKRMMKSVGQKIYDLKISRDQRKWEQAACALDTQKSAARLAQAAVHSAMAVQDCGATNFAERGKQGKAKCAVDVTAAIASAGIAASLITISTINCPENVRSLETLQKRLCAASIIDLTVAASYIGTSIASISGTCGTLDEYPGVPGT